ncbi:AAA family ATPase [Thermobifida halotolerans]|uniref:AAA family ATPase n=1 Tax=Thermobifida halotolerans TaxID=483545 RepID=A0AA97LXU7_9ACTN|nr:AAA family ATPase [Thermobifida halotolerans]UOE20089.1 AAA family ATPase [Thermobifida halotolerans]
MIASPPYPEGPARPDERVLRYPRRCLVLLGGLPGAGKSTLLGRLYGLSGAESTTVRTADGVRVVDSLQARNRLTPYLAAVPYPSWRWITHLLHYLRVLVALRCGGPVIAHETGTRRLVRLLFALYCRLVGAELHVLLIDAAPDEARRGQFARGRRVSAHSFRRHLRRWRALRDAVVRDPRSATPAARSLVLLDRSAAARLERIEFTRGESPRPGGTHGSYRAVAA